MKGKEKLFDLDRIKTYDPRILLITDGPKLISSLG